MRIVGGGDDDAMNLGDGGRDDGDGGIAGAREKAQDPAPSKELNTEAYVELPHEDAQAKR
jgi:hypothetical protein